MEQKKRFAHTPPQLALGLHVAYLESIGASAAPGKRGFGGERLPGIVLVADKIEFHFAGRFRQTNFTTQCGRVQRQTGSKPDEGNAGDPIMHGVFLQTKMTSMNMYLQVESSDVKGFFRFFWRSWDGLVFDEFDIHDARAIGRIEEVQPKNGVESAILPTFGFLMAYFFPAEGSDILTCGEAAETIIGRVTPRCETGCPSPIGVEAGMVAGGRSRPAGRSRNPGRQLPRIPEKRPGSASVVLPLD